MRGVPTFDLDDAAILVRSPCAKVADSFRKRRKLSTWIPNAAGKTVTVIGECFLVYQLKGHPWATISEFGGRYSTKDAKGLSKSLATRAIYFGNSDTSGVTEYDLYENGKQLEHFFAFDGITFKSTIRDVEPPDDGPDIYPFIDDFIRRQDAYIPYWSALLFDNWRRFSGDKVKLDFNGALSKTILDRFDFLSA
jgi:hypothetical protein